MKSVTGKYVNLYPDDWRTVHRATAEVTRGFCRDGIRCVSLQGYMRHDDSMQVRGTTRMMTAYENSSRWHCPGKTCIYSEQPQIHV